MGGNRRHKRKTRHRAKGILKHGPNAVRAHKKIAGRTGSIHSKRTRPNSLATGDTNVR